MIAGLADAVVYLDSRPSVFHLRHLAAVARDGFEDMLPALRRAFNAERNDDRLDQVFGPAPRTAIAGIIVIGVVLGNLLARPEAGAALAEWVSMQAIIIGAAYALAFRRYLFGDSQAREDDFPWLAASLIPAVVVLVVLEFGRLMLEGGAEPLAGAPAWTSIAALADSLARALVTGAALVIAVAALCYSRDWPRALLALTRRLILFKITVFVMVLLLIEIGIVGPVLGGIVEAGFGITVPGWLGETADLATHAGLMGTLYLFIIGATWSAARAAFGDLLREGQADILQAVSALARPPEKP